MRGSERTTRGSATRGSGTVRLLGRSVDPIGTPPAPCRGPSRTCGTPLEPSGKPWRTMIGGELIHGCQGTPLDPFITPAGPLPEPKLCNAKTKVCKAKKDKIAMPKTKLCNAKKQTLQCKTRDVALQILFVAVQNFNFRPQKLCNATEKHCNARNMNPRSCILPRKMHYWANKCSAIKQSALQ